MHSRTYRAVLRGNRVEWLDPPPILHGETEVEITILESQDQPGHIRRERRRQAVSALAEIAAKGGIGAVGDPAEWERKIRGC